MQIPVVCGKTDRFLLFTVSTFQRVFERQKNQLKIHIFGKFEHFYISIANKVPKYLVFFPFQDNLTI
jgi:hypothetical protein